MLSSAEECEQSPQLQERGHCLCYDQQRSVGRVLETNLPVVYLNTFILVAFY